MPVPKIFKRFKSKSSLRVGPDAVIALGVPLSHEKEASSKTLVAVAAVVPAYPENLTEAWAAAHKELPEAQGVEKFLNHIGASTIGVPICSLTSKRPHRGCTEQLDPFARSGSCGRYTGSARENFTGHTPGR